ncbi:uncharacterized protein J5F26_003116 isoform 2-T2 [Ciconia maguari]
MKARQAAAVSDPSKWAGMQVLRATRELLLPQRWLARLRCRKCSPVQVKMQSTEKHWLEEIVKGFFIEENVQYYQDAARYMGEFSKQDNWHRSNCKDMAAVRK